jgi:Ribulose-5-phosphate 4-epimerase and related epimerases and aldolases
MTSRPEIGAVVHTHSMFATTLSCLGLEIPALHYMIAATGADRIPCAPYATYGTQETADNAVKALKGRNACLLANHGMIVVGPNLKKAMWLAVEVETLAAQYWRASRSASLRSCPSRDRSRHRQVQDLRPGQGAGAGMLLRAQTRRSRRMIVGVDIGSQTLKVAVLDSALR